MTEIVYAIDIMTIIYIIIAIPIVVFLISVIYHYTQVLVYRNVSKKLEKFATEGGLAIKRYNEVLSENAKLREELNNGDMNDKK